MLNTAILYDAVGRSFRMSTLIQQHEVENTETAPTSIPKLEVVIVPGMQGVGLVNHRCFERRQAELDSCSSDAVMLHLSDKEMNPMLKRLSCPFCTRKHLASARRVLWELAGHGDSPTDPHLEIFLADLEHAEQQCPYPQLTDRIRQLKKVFDDNDVWTTKEFTDWAEKTNTDVDALLVSMLMELRELVKLTKETKND